MGDFRRTLCFLGPDQVTGKVDISKLAALGGDGNLKIVANVFDASAEAVLDDEDAYVAAVKALMDRGRKTLAAMTDGLEGDWPYEVVWDRTGKDWLDDNHEDYDLVVMFGQRDKANYSLPSEWSLLRELERPLYVISPSKKKGGEGKAVLAAVDIANKSQAYLNTKVMASAAKLARLADAELHMIAVIPMSEVVADLEFIDRRKYKAGFKKKHGAELQALGEKFGVGEETIHMEIGVPHKVIQRVAKKLGVLATAVGTVQRKGVPGFIVGNTVEKVLGLSQRNVLVVPEDD